MFHETDDFLEFVGYIPGINAIGFAGAHPNGAKPGSIPAGRQAGVSGSVRSS